MAETSNTPDVQRFDKEVHDVTCCCELIFCGKSTLTLGEEDAELSSFCLAGLCKSNKRGPYGELGTVDAGQCCCCYGFGAASLMSEEQLKCIGCGCDREKVDALVEELKKRQGLRGDRAKVRMAESTLASLTLMHKKLDALMEKMEVPPVTDEMER